MNTSYLIKKLYNKISDRKSVFVLIILSLTLYSPIQAQPNKAAYIFPDIGAPGMNVYIELIAHVDSL